MISSMYLVTFLGFVIGIIAIGVIIINVLNGQFDDTEVAKYKMLDDDDEQPH